ncbi:MAG: PASTA domain-containing protein [Corynebacterium nuruki]|nr:PASTA domain-containing protein [Corynebacterium nuruki]
MEAAAPEAAPIEDLPIPDGLEGMNGQLAYEKLKDAGFTGVVPTSVDPGRAMPVLYNNWTVTSVEPGPGETVPADSTVILNMTKE